MKFFFLFIVIFVAGALADISWALPAAKTAVAAPMAKSAAAAPVAKPAVAAPTAEPGAAEPGTAPKTPAEKQALKAATTETAADMAGLRVLSVGPKSLLDQLGIKKNDVLVSLNGQAITSINDIEKFFQERKAKTVNLELLRNGRPETFTYDLK